MTANDDDDGGLMITGWQSAITGDAPPPSPRSVRVDGNR